MTQYRRRIPLNRLTCVQRYVVFKYLSEKGYDFNWVAHERKANSRQKYPAVERVDYAGETQYIRHPSEKDYWLEINDQVSVKEIVRVDQITDKLKS